jgi:hypothetical protein
LAFYDETLPIINKSKHPPQKREETRNEMEVQEDDRATKEGELQREHQVPEPHLVARNISNKERGGAPKRIPNLQKPSPMATTRLKIKIARYSIINTFCL